MLIPVPSGCDDVGVLAGRPDVDIAVPAQVHAVAGGEQVRAVWENELGGLSFAIGAEPTRYVKWNPAGSPVDLEAEAVRLRWAARFVKVPSVIEFGADEEGAWLVTTALPGENAVTERWKAEPATVVTAIGEGL